MSNKDREPDPKDFRYLQFVTGRLHGLADSEIAAKWDLSSAGLYQRLSSDGYPVCPVCGAAPVTGEHCKQPPGAGERSARKAGAVEELPPAKAATGLFRERLEALLRAAETLQYREEKRQGGRFFVTEVQRAVAFHASALSQEEQNKVSELCGVDPKTKVFVPPGVRLVSPAGGSPYPPAPLPALIAAYLLAGGELEPLLKVLHPYPTTADREHIMNLLDAKKKKGGPHFDGLRVLAERLAKVVRGGEDGRGAPPPDLSNMEQNIACRITERRETGFTDEEIIEEFAHLRKEDGTAFTIKDIQRLGNFGLRYPEVL